MIVLSGLPGSGKSGVARGIAIARGYPVLSVDPIESAIVTAGIPRSFETGLAAYVVAETLAGEMLGAGLSVVIDAVNAVEEARDMWRRLAPNHGADLRIIECVVSDETVHAERVAARDRGLAIPEPSWDEVVRRRAEWAPWPEPHLTLDAIDSLDSNVARAMAYLDLP
ncbi:MAG: ATP-binding protein [Candidatus Limnocylindrales bacterium]